MKITVTRNKNPGIHKYPRLKIHNTANAIILFTSPNIGTVVALADNREPQRYNIGAHHDDWNESNFKPFYGTVQLSND